MMEAHGGSHRLRQQRYGKEVPWLSLSWNQKMQCCFKLEFSPEFK